MKDRIMKIMKDEGMDQKDFAAALKISPSSLSNIFNGRSNPTSNHVSAIHRRFPEININWLMFGEGEMYKPVNEDEFASLPLFSDSNLPTITAQPQEASGVSQEASVEPSIITHEKAEVDKNESLSVIKETIKYIDKPQRKITEIRIFFDDGTYEVFPGNR